MATEFTTKVRLVRCPKCQLLLPELPDFQVYKCGGCGALLQAKNRLKGLGHVYEDKASSRSSSTSCNGTLPDSGECSSDQIDEKNQNKSSGACSFERNMERDESKSLSEGYELSNSSLKAKVPAMEECTLERMNERNDSGSSKGIESSSSNLEALAPALGECFLERRHEREGSNSADGIESSSSSPKSKAPDLGVYSLERSHERERSKSSEGIDSISSSPKATTLDLGECPLERNIERECSKSSEGIESCSSSPKATFPDSGECFSDHSSENNQNKFSDDQESPLRDPDNSSEDDHGGERIGDINLPSKIQSSQSHQNGYGGLAMEPLRVLKKVSSLVEFANSESKVPLPETAANSEALEDDERLPLEPNVEVDIVVEIDSDSTSSSRLDAVATRGSDSMYSAPLPPRDSILSDIIVSSPDEQSNEKVDLNMGVDSSAVNPGATWESGVTAHNPAQESSSGTLTSSADEKLKEPHDSVLKNFDHLMSSNTFETTEFLSPRSEFSAAFRDRSKSPASRSHHAYDASVSSHDGIDDQFYNQNLPTFQDAHTAPNLAQSEERNRREIFFAENMRNKGPELPNQARSSWSSMSDKNSHAMNYRNPDQEMLPPRIPGHPSRDHARVLHRNEYMPRMASLQGDYLGGYGNGCFANQIRKEFPSNIDYRSGRYMSAAADKLALMRIVRELQNELFHVRASRQEQHIPQFHNYEASEEELFPGLNHPRDQRSSRAGSHYNQQQSQYTRIPFSSEATTSRHQVDPSFMHHYPQDRQYSAPLPLPIRSNTNGLHRLHPYASRQWDSESDDQRHNSHEVKKYYGEKQQMPMRHFRPIAGGAPILICYNCFKPLQIPADFLLFKRRCHRLRCGGCSKVLTFSLHRTTHIVPYEANAVGPPPSEVNDHSYGVNGDPVSCSDDYGYGLSYCRSGSTEAEDAGNVTPANSLQSTIVHERDMSYGSNNPTRGRQEIVSQNKDKNPIGRFMSAKNSSNMLKSNNHSSEMKLPPKSSSPLHRLMGYNSPSQVIRGSGLSRSGTTSSVRNYEILPEYMLSKTE
ncbi:uncharacterized protein LOC126801689 [Argentina anserina]|uniref:uncharacterized protein LOC126801689 n=1 Tax=Argentina anserina TaxID=57926 RepID=UPI0021763943|nr:uncharacterized protein LOC126801689 [Potentilla anserina]